MDSISVLPLCENNQINVLCPHLPRWSACLLLQSFQRGFLKSVGGSCPISPPSMKGLKLKRREKSLEKRISWRELVFVSVCHPSPPCIKDGEFPFHLRPFTVLCQLICAPWIVCSHQRWGWWWGKGGVCCWAEQKFCGHQGNCSEPSWRISEETVKVLLNTANFGNLLSKGTIAGQERHICPLPVSFPCSNPGKVRSSLVEARQGTEVRKKPREEGRTKPS